MKKILGVSVIAMLAVSPMTASAVDKVHASINPQTGEEVISIPSTDGQKAASVQYVKEAYNAMAGAVNTDLEGKEDTFNATTHTLNGAYIQDSTVDSTQLAADAVTTDKLANGAVEEDDIAANAVTTAKLANGAVEEDDLAANAVTTAKLANGAVTSDKIANGNVTTDKILDGTILKEDLSSEVQDLLDVADDAASKEGLIATINHSTALTEVPLYTGWASGGTPTRSENDKTSFDSSVYAPGNGHNQYYDSNNDASPETIQ